MVWTLQILVGVKAAMFFTFHTIAFAPELIRLRESEQYECKL